MDRMLGTKGRTMLTALAGMLLSAPLLPAQAPPTPVPPGTPVTITVTQATPATPPASFTLHGRHRHVIPVRSSSTHPAGGNNRVAHPSPHTGAATLTDGAAASAACD